MNMKFCSSEKMREKKDFFYAFSLFFTHFLKTKRIGFAKQTVKVVIHIPVDKRTYT
jgi:hypothetical protein